MTCESRISDVDVKKANILHHDAEAEFFERVHSEGSSVYERAEVSKSLAFVVESSSSKDLCVDVGCGTGFVVGFELPLYKTVVALDISRKMLEAVRNKFGDVNSINLLLCDAEFLPLRSEIADLVSVSSVLHHLPKPFNSMIDMLRVIKRNGFFYIVREPNFYRLRRFFDFFEVVIGKLVGLAQIMTAHRFELFVPRPCVEGLDYAKVDVQCPTGFHVMQLAEFLGSRNFKVMLAYSYHWIYPGSYASWLQQLLTRSNFVVERIPISNRFGRYVTVLAKKLTQVRLSAPM
jgi:SAM-dependent methyltransferase